MMNLEGARCMLDVWPTARVSVAETLDLKSSIKVSSEFCTKACAVSTNGPI